MGQHFTKNVDDLVLDFIGSSSGLDRRLRFVSYRSRTLHFQDQRSATRSRKPADDVL
ncbi:hypothetical protein SynA1528_01098 [Synechococcus sp. A15-28]|nr:hypothetical protein SynA1528_01098 [Synechococcus sp. A15-28]